MSAKYGNFADPLGLVFRMLRSFKLPAYSALIMAAFEALALPLDALLAKGEKKRVSAAGTVRKPIILVVGLPRSGTTLVYQTLAQSLHVSYFDNFSALFPKATCRGARLVRRNFDAAPQSFESFYGSTAGFRGVNDGFHVWNRWLGSDRYYATERLSPEQADDMRRFFGAWTDAFSLPVLNKNNRNTLCVSLLSEVLDSSFFIVVERDPVFVAQSLYMARKEIQGDDRIGWGLGAEGENPVDDGRALKSVTDQVKRVRRQLAVELAKVDPERVMRIKYEDFCKDPRKVTAGVADRIACFRPADLPQDFLRNNRIPKDFPAVNRERLSAADLATIRRALSQLDNPADG